MITDLGTLGGQDTEALALNERGQIVGSNPVHDRAFLWENGRMRDLGTLGGDYSRAVAINERGQIVGWADTRTKDEDGYWNRHAFLWQNGKMTDLGTLGGDDSEALGINDSGEVIGQADTKGASWEYQDEHAALWRNGRTRDLGTLGGRVSWAVALNERGQIIGWSAVEGGGDEHAFLWEDGTMRDLGARFLPASPPWAGWGASNALNERGQVVGSVLRDRTHYTRAAVWESGRTRLLDRLGTNCKALDINEQDAVVGFCAVRPHGLARPRLWRGGRVRDLGLVFGDRGFAVALNNRGQVIGNSRAGSGKFHAFVWEDGKMTDLSTLPGEKGSVAVAINNRGQIIGWSETRTGSKHAVLWTLKR